MKIHILNGDCLQDILQSENAIIVREMFVEGPIKADSFDALLRERATYLEKTYSIPFDEYQRKSVSEFEKLKYIPNHTEVFIRQFNQTPLN